MKAGKLTEKILMLFMATGKDEVLALIQSLNIQLITPVLPTSKLYFELNVLCQFQTVSLSYCSFPLQDAPRNFKIEIL